MVTHPKSGTNWVGFFLANALNEVDDLERDLRLAHNQQRGLVIVLHLDFLRDVGGLIAGIDHDHADTLVTAAGGGAQRRREQIAGVDRLGDRFASEYMARNDLAGGFDI